MITRSQRKLLHQEFWMMKVGQFSSNNLLRFTAFLLVCGPGICQTGVTIQLIWPNLPESCKKIKKKLDRGRGMRPWHPLDLPILPKQNSAKPCGNLKSVWPSFLTHFTPLFSPPHFRANILILDNVCSSPGVDYCDSITMYFKDKRVAQLNLHQESVLSNCAFISGDKGTIEVSGMNCKCQDN